MDMFLNKSEQTLNDMLFEMTYPQILVVVDMQNDFIDGVFGTEEAQDIVTNVADIVEKYKFYGKKVIFTQDTHDAMSYDGLTESEHFPAHCIRGTWGWQISKAINTDNCHILQKGTFACPELIDEIHTYLNIYTNMPNHFPIVIQVVGLCTDICVISNVLMLQTMYPYARIVVNTNLCAGTTPEKHEEALDVIKSCGIYVVDNYDEICKDTDDEDTDEDTKEEPDEPSDSDTDTPDDE